jgi:peptide/nickel transport system substrate-binding protein
MVARLAALLATALVITSCSGSQAGSGGSAEDARLTVAVAEWNSEEWLPHLTAGAAGNLAFLVHDSLIYRDSQTGEFGPGLARSWTTSDDGLLWTFQLRDDVAFHGDWGPFTAHDVKFTLEMITREGATNPESGYLRGVIEEVAVVDDHTVTIATKSVTNDLYVRLANGPLPFNYIVSKKYVETVGEKEAGLKPVGTGPFRFVSRATNESATFEAVTDHWRSSPKFAELVVRLIPDPSTAIAALASGDVDISEIPGSLVNEAKAAADIRYLEDSTYLYMSLGGQYLPSEPTYRSDLPWVGPDPEKAKKVRQALNYAVDRKTIIESLLSGGGSPGSTPFAYANDAWFPADEDVVPYDPDRARALLAEAGYPAGFDVTMRLFRLPTGAELPDVGEAVAQYWEAIGITVKRAPQDYSTQAIPDMRGRKQYDVMPFATSRAAEPWQTFSSNSHSNSSVPLMAIDETLNTMIDQARNEIDPQARVALNQKMVEYMRDQFYVVTIGAKHTPVGVGERVASWPAPKGMSRIHYLDLVELK